MTQTFLIGTHLTLRWENSTTTQTEQLNQKLRNLSHGSKLNNKKIKRVPINSNKSLLTKTNAKELTKNLKVNVQKHLKFKKSKQEGCNPNLMN